MLAAENWCVKVDEKIYGPYTAEQMRNFAHEGRLAAWSLIAPAGSRAWREARTENTFRSFFGFDRPESAKGKKRKFGKRDCAANDDPSSQLTTSNFILVFDIVSAAATRLEAAIVGLGPAVRIADNVWNVNCELTAVGVRNVISPYMRPSEFLFVVDATRGHTSWHNLPPEVRSKIARAYAPRRPLEDLKSA